MSFDLLMLCASLFTWGFGESMFYYFQPIYLQQLGADTIVIAGVFSLMGLAMMVTHIPAGYLADRFGRKPLLLAAWIIGLLAAGLMALARTLPVFVAGMLIYGFTAFVSSPMNSYITAARGKLSVARAMTLISAAYNLGAVAGPITGGWVGSHYGLRTIYLIATGIFTISTIILFFIHSQRVEKKNPETTFSPVWKNSRFVSLMGIVFISIFVMYMPQPLTPRFLQNERGLGLESIGLLGSIVDLGTSVLAIILGRLPVRLGFLLAELSVAAFAFLLWKGTGLPWYGLGYFLLGGFRSARSLIFAQIHPLVHSVQMGIAYGVSETCASLAVMLAPILAGFLYTRQPESVYWISGLLILVTAVVSYFISPHKKRETPPEYVPPLER
jgi:MFS family permease